MTRQEFLSAARAAALECARRSGLPAGVTVAQAALESAWGQSQLSREANNYFGIKAHGGLPCVELRTSEVREEVAVRVRARFAKYDSMQACFEDRDRLILKSGCYTEARACASEPLAFMQALARHWATDPDYAEKLKRIYRDNRLYELDETDNPVGAPPERTSVSA